jgi:hypothetical protein
MQRRSFLGTAAAVPVGLAPSVKADQPPSGARLHGPGPAAILHYSADDQRRRLLNIADSERSIRKCLRRHRITSYIPGQVAYHLGEYPSRKPYQLGTDYDEQELDRLYKGGIRLVQVMEDWNDLLRLFGGDKFTAVNDSGLRRFIDMVHRRGMKMLLYMSTGHFQRTDPDFQQEWARPGYSARGAHWQLVGCSPASPKWRAYVLPHILRMLDDYELDGLYNDAASKRLYVNPEQATKDEVLAFEETATHEGAREDLFALIYSEVKRRGGIMKMHYVGSKIPQMRQLWDYLWVGEGANNADKTREECKNHPPYVVPCLDLSTATVQNEDELYLHSIPYMQFPLLLAGRPFTGERSSVPGIKYEPEDRDPLLRRWRKIWRYYQANPQAPAIYGPWDAFPPRPNARAVHAKWLQRYLPMAEEGTLAYLEISDSSLFSAPLAPNVVASMFVNLKMYLVLANYGESSATVETSQSYIPSDGEASAQPGKRWTLPPRTLHILLRA